MAPQKRQVQPPSKNPSPSTPISNPKPDSSSESESGSKPPNAKVKSLASKPMKAQPQAQAQSTHVPARSGIKRPNESGSKRAKKKTAAASGGGSENEEVVAKKGSDADKSLALSEMCKFGEAAGLSKDAIRRGMDLMAESKVDEFAEGWRKVHIVEMELFVTRGQLRTDQARILLDAMKKEAMKKSIS